MQILGITFQLQLILIIYFFMFNGNEGHTLLSRFFFNPFAKAHTYKEINFMH